MKKTKSAADKALEIITQKKLNPIPKWEFIAKNSIIWFLSGLSVLAGALAISVLVFMVVSNDWDLLYFPYFWLLILTTLTATAYIGYRRTKKGYRREFNTVIFFVISLSLGLGLLFSFFQVGEKIDTLLARDFPIYRQIAPLKYQTWMNPEEGFLAGRITRISDSEFNLTDLNGRSWEIMISSSTLIRSRVDIKIGTEIKIIGRQLTPGKFAAAEIRPWLNRFGN